MRQERDSLGELLLSDEACYGIGTARLIAALPVSDRPFPVEIAKAIIQIREAQAIAFWRNGQWPAPLGEAIQAAARKALSEESLLANQVLFNTLYGGGVRGVLDNVDEVLANLTLEAMGAPKGEYHRVAHMLQMELEADSLATFMTAVHIALLKEIQQIEAALDKTGELLKKRAEEWKAVRYLQNEHYRDIAISSLGNLFAQYGESLQRSRLQLDWLKSRLLPCWRGKPEVLLPLRESTGIDWAVCQKKHDFPAAADLYLNFSAQLKSLALILLQFCNAIGELLHRSQIDTSRIRAGQDFNPTEQEMIVPDTVSQMMFLIVGGDAALTAAICSGGNGASAYAPFYSSQLLFCAEWATGALNLLADSFVETLVCNTEAGEKKIDHTPLQAERLIPVLGYDRAVQVARIAALTEKPVRTVVVKIKLMTEEDAERIFSQPDSANE